MGVECIQRHLDGVECETRFDHLEVNFRILVSGETQIANFSLLFCFHHGFSGAVFLHEQFRIVVPAHAVQLPEIQMISLEPPQGLLQHLGRDHALTPVGADFGH